MKNSNRKNQCLQTKKAASRKRLLEKIRHVDGKISRDKRNRGKRKNLQNV